MYGIQYKLYHFIYIWKMNHILPLIKLKHIQIIMYHAWQGLFLNYMSDIKNVTLALLTIPRILHSMHLVLFSVCVQNWCSNSSRSCWHNYTKYSSYIFTANGNVCLTWFPMVKQPLLLWSTVRRIWLNTAKWELLLSRAT